MIYRKVVVFNHQLYISFSQDCNVGNCKLYMYVDSFVQDCSNSSDNAVELLQSCAKPSIRQTYL